MFDYLSNTMSDSTFLRQFAEYRDQGRYNPQEEMIEEVWCRLLRPTKYSSVQVSELLKGRAMAVIYMLHVETNTSTQHKRPPLENVAQNGFFRVSYKERERCKRFTKWIPCPCDDDCGKSWNFVNDGGLYNDQGNTEKCRVAKLLLAGS